jgi:hypothetical protein
MTSIRPLGTTGAPGIEITTEHGSLSAEEPVVVAVWDGSAEQEIHAPYDSLRVTGDGCFAEATLALPGGGALAVRDAWRAVDAGARCDRTVTVSAPLGPGIRYAFGTALVLRTSIPTPWADIEPFCPGVAYGNAESVATLAFAGAPARRQGITAAIVREDRMAAPLMALRGADGEWAAVLHLGPDGATVAADGMVENGGEVLVDERLRFASIGARRTPGTRAEGTELGVWFPGTEAPTTYSSGGLPLLQLPAPRPRYHPVVDGATQAYSVEFRTGPSAAFPEVVDQCMRWAWERLRPSVAAEPLDEIVRTATDVALERVVTTRGRTGVALEANADGPDDDSLDVSAVMGFVGANTDLALTFLREAARSGDAERGERLRASGIAILDTFAALPMSPPIGEGFDTRTGEPTSYRSYRGAPAVYARSLAEGALAMLEAARDERMRGNEHPGWLTWTGDVARWLIAGQRADGSLPRAWAAGSGDVLDDSPSGTAAAVPFLTAARELVAEAGPAAERAADFVWQRFGDGSYTGATLDNPDVVDKEAAILAAEAFLALAEATDDAVWVTRAESAASVAASWIYLWDVPMPVDADAAGIHWKPGVPTTGLQLIASGVSMVDGFLSVNASVFARLWQRTGDGHWLDVARIVTHGTCAMFATAAHPHDLRGLGWQQEHWSLAPRRGYGLNRRWLTWVPVAHVRGVQRLEDLGPAVARAVLQP